MSQSREQGETFPLKAGIEEVKPLLVGYAPYALAELQHLTGLSREEFRSIDQYRAGLAQQDEPDRRLWILRFTDGGQLFIVTGRAKHRANPYGLMYGGMDLRPIVVTTALYDPSAGTLSITNPDGTLDEHRGQEATPENFLFYVRATLGRQVKTTVFA